MPYIEEKKPDSDDEGGDQVFILVRTAYPSEKDDGSIDMSHT